MTDKQDTFGLLLDGLAEQIAARVVVRIEALLSERQQPVDAYRLDQAARALGLSEREVRRRIAAGELASRRVGRVLLIPREAVDAFLRNGSTT